MREKAQAKHEQMIASEGRTLVGGQYIVGEIVARAYNFMWVKPDDANKIPASARPKLQAMNDEFRAKSADSKKQFCGGIEENVVYCRTYDVTDESLVRKPGTKCKFKLYTDSKGVGGCDIMSV